MIRGEPLLFSGTISLNAEPARVWDFLLDAKAFAACVPGIEDVNQIDDRTFEGTINATIGPMSGDFPFRAQIEDSQPPSELSAHVEGKDSVTKSTIEAQLGMTLTPSHAGGTELAYRAVVDIHGRLAIIGDMVLRATAAVMLDEFTNRVRRNLEEGIAETV